MSVAGHSGWSLTRLNSAPSMVLPIAILLVMALSKSYFAWDPGATVDMCYSRITVVSIWSVCFSINQHIMGTVISWGLVLPSPGAIVILAEILLLVQNMLRAPRYNHCYGLNFVPLAFICEHPDTQCCLVMFKGKVFMHVFKVKWC
jgi:hypothetical protein